MQALYSEINSCALQATHSRPRLNNCVCEYSSMIVPPSWRLQPLSCRSLVTNSATTSMTGWLRLSEFTDLEVSPWWRNYGGPDTVAKQVEDVLCERNALKRFGLSMIIFIPSTKLHKWLSLFQKYNLNRVDELRSTSENSIMCFAESRLF